MRVVAATVGRVKLPLVHEFQTSSHRKTHLEHLLVKLTDESGAEAWGEIASPSDPYYGAETVDTCWTIATKYLIPALLGVSWMSPAEAAACWAKVRGNGFAKAGVDAAVWSLYASHEGISLASALGGTRTEVTAGVSLGIEPTIRDLLEQVRLQLEAGYPRVKLKIAPGWDVEPVRAVRDAFPELDLHVDANGVYRETPEHLDALLALDEVGLTMIEQPFEPHDLLAHARLQQRLSTPICLDESVETVADLRTALRLDAGRILNIKVSRLGGLTPALEAHDVAFVSGIPVWCGGMHEFGVGRAANLAISSLPGFVLPSDVSGSDKYYARDVLTEPIRAVAGRVPVPSRAGLGVEVDEQFIAANTVRSESFAVG
jgi:O-succinylbenzoate synthase